MAPGRWPAVTVCACCSAQRTSPSSGLRIRMLPAATAAPDRVGRLGPERHLAGLCSQVVERDDGPCPDYHVAQDEVFVPGDETHWVRHPINVGSNLQVWQRTQAL